MANREILFRGKTIGGNWVEGLFSKMNVDFYVFPENGLDSPDAYEIHPETLGQYTGLKDKNGVKIFEGDAYQPMQGPMFMIKYVDARFVGYNGISMPDLSTIHHGYMEKGVVVGNIHDQPELLTTNPQPK